MQTQTNPNASESPFQLPNSGLRAWLRAIDALLAVVEDTAWKARAAANRTWSAVREDWQRLAEESRSVGAEVGDWPARLARVTSTGWMLSKVASSYRLHLTAAAFTTQKRAARGLEKLHERNARRFRDTSAEQGGAFLKVGQLLSARPDLLPPAWIRELSFLQDAAPAFDFEQVRSIVEEDLGGSLEELFSSFEEEPVAAASIGQVHRATTPDGQVVAVKVRRPGIEDLVDLDMDLLVIFLDGMKSSLPPADYETIVTEIRSMVHGELDYTAERESMARIASFFQDVPKISTPQPIDQLSGQRVLSSPFVQGRKITEVLDELQEAGDSEQIAELLGLLIEAYLRQVLEAGIFQADPHPGNLLVTEQGELVVLDFGCTKPLPDASRRNYLALVQAFIGNDEQEVVRLLGELGFATRSGDPATLLAYAKTLLEQFRDAASGSGFSWPSQQEVLADAAHLLQATHDDPVDKLPSDFIMLARVFGTVGGMMLHYQPKIDYGRYVLPTLTRAMMS